MIAQDLAHAIGQQIAADIQIETVSSDRLVVFMPFIYDDGDQCSVYMTKSGEKTWELSDDGESLRRASYSGINLTTPAYADQIKSLTDFYGASQNEGVLGLQADDESLTRSLFTFTQTCLEASWLPKMAQVRKASDANRFARRFERLVATAVQRPVEKNWHHPVYDPQRIYPVDLHVAGNTKQLYLFGIPNRYACQRATIALQHYKLTGAEFHAVAIYDHEEQLPQIVAKQLNEVVDRRFPRISEGRQIRAHLAEMAAA